jgi:hypothetical protein
MLIIVSSSVCESTSSSYVAPRAEPWVVGERTFRFVDPFGYDWCFSQRMGHTLKQGIMRNPESRDGDGTTFLFQTSCFPISDCWTIVSDLRFS